MGPLRKYCTSWSGIIIIARQGVPRIRAESAIIYSFLHIFRALVGREQSSSALMQKASLTMVMLHINVALSHLHVHKKKVIGLWTVCTSPMRPLWACIYAAQRNGCLTAVGFLLKSANAF